MKLLARRPIAAALHRLRDDTSALALLEFGLSLPLVLAMGGYGVELSNVALVNLQISQYALTLADNASRVGVDSGLSTFQLNEYDINDVMDGARKVSAGLQMTTYGRVTLSSLENVKQPYQPPGAVAVQRIHWQRCIGLKSGAGYDSTYGTTSPSAGSDATLGNAGTLTPLGMGDPPSMVNAPLDSGVMFVEINYDYQPLFGTMFVGPTKIHYHASFIVRDRRDFSQIFPAPSIMPPKLAAAAKCNLYAA